MARWGLMLGGLVVWALHFAGLYALGSLADIQPWNGGLWRSALLGFSAACLAAAAGLLIVSLRKLKRPGPVEEPGRFVAQVAAAGAGLAILAIVFQTTAAVIAD